MDHLFRVLSISLTNKVKRYKDMYCEFINNIKKTIRLIENWSCVLRNTVDWNNIFELFKTSKESKLQFQT